MNFERRKSRQAGSSFCYINVQDKRGKNKLSHIILAEPQTQVRPKQFNPFLTYSLYEYIIPPSILCRATDVTSPPRLAKQL